MLAISMVTLVFEVPVVFRVTRVVMGVDMIPHPLTIVGLMFMSPVPVRL